jgi:hypothetical protein
VLRFNFTDFITWVEDNDFIYNDFDQLASLLTNYLLDFELCDTKHVQNIASKFEDVLKNCDEITYEEPGVSEAYTILHFLDRYHRFQLIILKLLKMGRLPTEKNIDCLDIGTGPSPSLFALSDIYSLIRKYELQKNIEKITDMKVTLDYVERGENFRNWLHRFTEYANYHSNKKYMVPYHHGTFRDYANIEFNYAIKNPFIEDDDSDELYYKKFRYNFVILSNFLTNSKVVSEFSESLYKTALNMRNRGIIVIVGAVSQSSKYKVVYDSIRSLFLNSNYSNYKFIASCKEVYFADNRMFYNYDDRFGTRIKKFYQMILKRCEDYDAMSLIPKESRDEILRTIDDGYNKEIKWEIYVFYKSSKLRKQRFSKENT